MILAIDGYEANSGHRVGVGEYAYQLLCQMHSLIGQMPPGKRHTVRVYLPQKPRSDMPKKTGWWQYRVRKPGRLWTLFALPISLWLDHPRADVIFSPTHYVPRFTAIPRAMAIMDLSYLEYPSLFRAKDLHKLVHWTAYSVKNAKKIFTISEFSKNAIMKTYGLSGREVIVTYPGLIMTKKNKKADTGVELQQKYNLGSRYILSVGTLQPRKNYVRLIEAFSLLQQKSDTADLQLVIAGKKGWLFEEILAAPRKYGVESKVIFLDYVPDKDLPSLYEHAICFALPSLYEGFGLPVLEAMANGCQVVVSNVSSLPEIAGDAGIYCEPEDVASITTGLSKAVKDFGSAKAKERISWGKDRVKLFNWNDAAEKTLAVLEQIVKK